MKRYILVGLSRCNPIGDRKESEESEEYNYCISDHDTEIEARNRGDNIFTHIDEYRIVDLQGREGSRLIYYRGK